MPVLLWQLWRFVTPGLYPNERRWAVPFVGSALLLFVLGAALAYWTMPKALDFLIDIGGEDLEPFFTPQNYIRLITYMMLAFGIGLRVPDPPRVPPARRDPAQREAPGVAQLRRMGITGGGGRDHPERRPHQPGRASRSPCTSSTRSRSSSAGSRPAAAPAPLRSSPDRARSSPSTASSERRSPPLDQRRSVLVAAPTGSGKTVVAEHAVEPTLAQSGKAFYTTPIKALSNQKFADLGRRTAGTGWACSPATTRSTATPRWW